MVGKRGDVQHYCSVCNNIMKRIFIYCIGNFFDHLLLEARLSIFKLAVFSLFHYRGLYIFSTECLWWQKPTERIKLKIFFLLAHRVLWLSNWCCTSPLTKKRNMNEIMVGMVNDDNNPKEKKTYTHKWSKTLDWTVATACARHTTNVNKIRSS